MDVISVLYSSHILGWKDKTGVVLVVLGGWNLGNKVTSLEREFR
jgi:hypothetical protein